MPSFGGPAVSPRRVCDRRPPVKPNEDDEQPSKPANDQPPKKYPLAHEDWSSCDDSEDDSDDED